ncbi:MAG: AAA family ATPase [Candidatus Brockarchaeota archaeon]|nr:AAA family ATPase [Candidatus Brockarchaeota archaeon]
MSGLIETLRLRNLERYRNVQLDFSAGLNLIKGRNSTGKTTLLNALTFALFGEVPEARPKLLVSKLPGSGEMSVYVRFRSPVSGKVVEVERRGSLDRNGDYRTLERILRIDGKNASFGSEEDLRSMITELLGMSLRKFINLVYVRQGRLTEILEPQREQMDSVMGITLLRELREQLDGARRELERFNGKDAATEIQSLEERVPELDSSLKQIDEDICRLNREVQELENLLKKAESSELTELLNYIKKREEVEEELKKISSRSRELLEQAGVSSIEKLEEKVSLSEKELEALKAARNSLKKELDASMEKWLSVKSLVENLAKQVRERESLAGSGASKCPTCGQDLQPAVIQRILEEDRSSLAKASIEEAEARKVYEARSFELQNLVEKINAVEGEYSRMKTLRRRLKEYLDSAETLVKTRGETIATVKEKLKVLDLPFTPEDPELKLKLAQQLPLQPEELARRKGELAEKKKVLERKKSMRADISRKLEDYSRLLNQLKRRMEKAGLAHRLSQLFDQAVETRRRELIKRIEFRALEYYRAMTDQHVYDAIIINPEDYSVSVHPKGLTDPIPATRVGGGHQTILALAIRLALLDALGLNSLLILDEPTYGVDSENLPQVASYIGEASKQLSQMILVTHYNICEEEASNIIEVSVQEDGSSKAEIKT